MNRLPARLILILLAAGFGAQLCAAEAEAEAKPPAASGPGADDDANWVLQANPNRRDVFYDEIQRLQLETTAGAAGSKSDQNNTSAPDQSPLDFARATILECDRMLNERKWAEGEKLCESAIRRLAPNAGDKDVAQYLQNIQGYQAQFKEARERDEAEAAFDALHLTVEGILWAETGPRLAILSGEPRALGINDRVKDCVIINIDTDRVDFRFHFKRKRFEFPRYVGEESKNK
jgi:hypothetical protein